MRKLFVILAIAAALTNFVTLSAYADLVGTSITFTLTDFPDSVTSITTTVGGGPTVVDDVGVYSFVLPTAGGGDTLYIYFYTTDGAPIAASSTADWEIDASIPLTQAVTFDGIENQWTTTNQSNAPSGVGGIPVPESSLTPSGFDNFAGFGPLGVGYVNGYGTTGNAFSDPLAAGIFLLPTFVDPYSYAIANGIPLDASGFNIALHFDPVSVPEPITLLFLVPGLVGLAAIRRKVKK
jgi:hypothetical protein